MKLSVVVEEDVQRHQEGKGLTPLHPVLLDQDDNITINNIERIVEKASTFQNSSKSLKQIKEELQSWTIKPHLFLCPLFVTVKLSPESW